MSQIAAERGFAPPNPGSYQMQVNHPGAFLVGSVSEVRDRLQELKEGLGLSRYILQMDLGNLDHLAVMKSIELLGTEIAPELTS
jgi:alkanesulfonate monooxygenase SsuD/methylene tetrahydromethanopterin reductase-like flavin-dependent oxidoreductase (luciferase family)